MTPITLAAISGSLRKGSFNTAILRAMKAQIDGPDVRMEIFPLNALPLYDQDLETGAPPAAVQALRAAVRQAHGVVIASPEYNHGVSGVLKNALDWLSRPQGQAVLTGKPVLTLTSSPGITGGVRAQAQLNATLNSIAARAVLRPQLIVPSAHQKIRDGQLTDTATLEHLARGLADLLRDIRQTASVAIEQN
jgi:chromate reductase, NAD(P)H dehydrogenase (quinone)